MEGLSGLVRLDKEFEASLETLLSQTRTDEPLPCAVNGLCQGAVVDYLLELCRAISDRGVPLLIIAPSEEERDRVASSLSAIGIETAAYKPRNFVLYNISASHDCERERLSALHRLISGELSAIVTTPDAAASYTLSRETLLSSSRRLRLGDTLSPSELCSALSLAGYKRVGYD